MSVEEFHFSDGPVERRILREGTTTYEVGLQAPDVTAGIEEIVAAMFFRSGCDPGGVAKIRDALCAREKAMSTGIGFGMAFPHAFAEVTTKHLGFFLAPKGLAWGAIDNVAVRVIVCSVVPRNQFETRGGLLEEIGQSLSRAKGKISFANEKTTLREWRTALVGGE